MNCAKPRLFHRFAALMLSLFLLVSSLCVPAFAEGEAKAGFVTGDYVNVRNAPGTYGTQVITQVHYNQPITILGQESDRDGDIWYRVSFTQNGTNYEGFIYSEWVAFETTPSVPVEPNPDFDSQLASFPESYQAALRSLHEQHPSWNFIAYNTGLDWNHIQSLENRLGWSYINDGIISHYSTAPGSYDWETDTYFVKEGSNWYQAHPDMVAYYMDPRNFLNQGDLFQFELLAYSPSTQTEENIAAMLRGSFMEGKTTANYDGIEVSYARAFLDAANASGVSAFHLVTRCIQEVGWGGSETVHGNFGGELNGYYNFFNIGANGGAYDGMVYAKNHGWDTPYKAIMAGGEFISSGYIARGQNTPYFQKYNVVDQNNPATHQYMTNIAAALSEGRIQRGEYVEMGFFESAFTFYIPVYQNMPANPCAAPAPAGSPNNYLKNLWVDGYSLSPTFDFYDCLNNGRTNYDIIIEGNVSSIRVNAVAVSASASITGNIGNVSLATGENRLTITCTAANGASRNYTIRVIVKGEGTPENPPSGGEIPDPNPPSPPSPPAPIPSGWNHSYRVNGSNLSGLSLGMNSDAFLSSLGTYGNAYAYLTDESGNPFSGVMRTGLVLNYYDGAYTSQYRIVLFGDVNGDTVVDAIDLLLVRKNILGLQSLGNANQSSADVNRDGAVDAIDLLLVRKHILGLTYISQ